MLRMNLLGECGTSVISFFRCQKGSSSSMNKLYQIIENQDFQCSSRAISHQGSNPPIFFDELLYYLLKLYSKIFKSFSLYETFPHFNDRCAIPEASPSFFCDFWCKNIILIQNTSPQILIKCLIAKSIKIIMGVKLIILVALLALALADTSRENLEVQQRRDSSLTYHRLPPAGKRDADDIYRFVDHGLREKYWYYLTKACLLYVAAVQRSDTYQFLAIYRNIVGTFLAITSWKNQSDSFDVNTLVRLGNGYAKNSGANYKPVNLRLARFRYSLGPGQYLIDINDGGDVKLNGKVLSDDLAKNIGKGKRGKDSDELLVKRCHEFSEFTRKKFWYYLKGARVVYSSVGSTAERDYCLVTYVNVAGTFFAIGSDVKKTRVCEVNTFVRVGGGYEDDCDRECEPIPFEKCTLPLENYEE